MTPEQAGFLTVMRALLPPGSAAGRVARDCYLAALDIQDLWRWVKDNPDTISVSQQQDESVEGEK